MPRVTINENDYSTLYYHTSKRIVHYVIHLPVFGADYRDGMLKGIDLLREHGARKWLWDCRKGGAVLSDDVEWSRVQFYPRAVMAGWKYWAVILPEKIVGQLSMKRLASHFNQAGFTTEFFTTEEKALSWLIDQ